MPSPTFLQLEQLRLGPGDRSSMPSSNSLSNEPLAWLRLADTNSILSAISLVFSLPPSQWLDDSSTLTSFWVQLLRRSEAEGLPLGSEQLDLLATHYEHIDSRPELQSLLLRGLIRAKIFSTSDFFSPKHRRWELLATLLARDPLLAPRHLIEVFGELIRLPNAELSQLWPELRPLLFRPELTCFLLDLSNYAARQRSIGPHPFAVEQPKLTQLLAQVASRLAHLAEAPPPGPLDHDETVRRGRMVNEGVSLGVALCDALAWIGDRSAIPCLNQTAEVEHRRLHVEAITALARLDDPAGKKELIQLAADPVERLRVLSYVSELGMLDQVPPQYRDPLARAEATFVLFLAQPTQFGLPPHHVECVAERQWYWPGIDDLQTCYLFQFVYQFPHGEFTNRGITGPVTHCFQADLSQLDPDDVLAIFAGWDVSHPDIRAITSSEIKSGEDLSHQRRLLDRLRLWKWSEGEGIEPLDRSSGTWIPRLLGQVFDLRVLIVDGLRLGEPGLVLVADDQCRWFSQRGLQSPLSPVDVFHWFVGHEVLQMLQDQGREPGDEAH